MTRPVAPYILAWWPQDLNVDRTDPGSWDLQTRADYDASAVPSKPEWNYQGARDESAAVLTEWVSRQLGYPVALVGGYARWVADDQMLRIEPIYFVYPADEAPAGSVIPDHSLRGALL